MPNYLSQAEYDEILRRKYRIFIGDCWDFLGCLDKDGYGIIQQFGRAFKAHRKMYEMFKGPIPKGAHIHHTCHRQICGNPDHLAPKSPAAHNTEHAKRPTHCPQGHDYSEHGTIRTDTGYIRCRECGREYHRQKKRSTLPATK